MSEQQVVSFCTTCGLPLGAASCAACGGDGVPLALTDGDASSAIAYAPDAPRAELELARSALDVGDYGKLVSHCFAALGVREVAMQQAPGQLTFKALVRGATVFVRADQETGAFVIETPCARLPLTQYVPALRMLLELSDRDGSPMRFGARGDLVMARFVGRFGAVVPNDICSAIETVVEESSAAARLLVGALQARPFDRDEHLSLTIDGLSRGVALLEEVPVSVPQSPKRRPTTAPKKSPRRPTIPPGARPTPIEAVPAIFMPDEAGKAHMSDAGAGGLGRPTPTAQRPATRPASYPKIAAMTVSEPPRPFKEERRQATTAPDTRSAKRERASQEILQNPAETRATPNVNPLADTMASTEPSPKEPRTGLAGLLSHAQALGAALSFSDQPATMCLLVRAVVYRALYEFEAENRDGVIWLFHEAQPFTREIYITAPGKRRGSMAIPVASPAFEALAKLLSRPETCVPREPLVITPITTAQDAKQHLARYVSEIDQAPADLDLRHFLALGALSELLRRTKLPPATGDRLRGIISHALKEGPKQPAIDLMMTALSRMIA